MEDAHSLDDDCSGDVDDEVEDEDCFASNANKKTIQIVVILSAFLLEITLAQRSCSLNIR